MSTVWLRRDLGHSSSCHGSSFPLHPLLTPVQWEAERQQGRLWYGAASLLREKSSFSGEVRLADAGKAGWARL